MPRDLTLADRLRSAGLEVVEVAGWRTRGSEAFNPRGFVWHHTAGSPKGSAPSLAVCTYGRPGLPGPLCNVLLARDGKVYVVAAGRANHAGTGLWSGLSGNGSVYGLEIENVGTVAEPWREATLDRAARIAAATGVAVELCCQHKEWTSRKIDMHTIGGAEMRARVAALRAAPNDNDEDDDMGTFIRTTGDGAIYRLYGERFRRLTPAQFNRRRALAQLAGRTVVAQEMHPWAFAAFVIENQLIEDPATR